MPVFEFVVDGPPLSHQTQDRKRLARWRNKVRKAAARLWKDIPLSVALKITVAYYHEGTEVLMDNDNMIKPIQDALNGLLYIDDRLITDTVIRKTPIDSPIRARGASLTLLRAYSKGREFLHIQIDHSPDHTQTL
jgi:crossover junction endodeoxyribonuclease RusA